MKETSQKKVVKALNEINSKQEEIRVRNEKEVFVERNKNRLTTTFFLLSIIMLIVFFSFNISNKYLPPSFGALILVNAFLIKALEKHKHEIRVDFSRDKMLITKNDFYSIHVNDVLSIRRLNSNEINILMQDGTSYSLFTNYEGVIKLFFEFINHDELKQKVELKTFLKN